MNADNQHLIRAHFAADDYIPALPASLGPRNHGIVLDIARSAKSSAPPTAAAMQQFLAAAGMRLGAQDDAAVAKVYARNAGLNLAGEE